jgi:hypothetical protein
VALCLVEEVPSLSSIGDGLQIDASMVVVNLLSIQPGSCALSALFTIDKTYIHPHIVIILSKGKLASSVR